MKSITKILFSLIFILVLISTLRITQIEAANSIVQQWEYIAPEMDSFDLYGGISQWDIDEAERVFLKDIEGSEEVFVMDVYFGYNSTHLFIGIVNPDQGKKAYGFEIVFISDGDIYHGIVVDSVLEEGREITFLNTTHVAFDRDLGGTEFVDVNKEDVIFDEHYLIADDIRYPQQGLEGYWDFDAGDSAAVIFQAWVHEEKDATNRPNFSTAVDGFSYLRLSIGYDGGYPLDLHSLFPSSTGQVSNKDIIAKKSSELNYVLDGNKDEDFWKTTQTQPVEISQIVDLAAGYLLPSGDSITCNFSSVYDDSDLLIHIAVQKEHADTSLEELTLLLEESDDSWYNLSSNHLVCHITPTGYHIFEAQTAELLTNGLASERDLTGLIFLDIANWANASGHFDLYEGEGGTIVESDTDFLVEFIVPIKKEESSNQIGIDISGSPNVILAVNAVYEAKTGVLIGWTMEADQVKIIMHKMIFSDDDDETTTLDLNFTEISSIILIFTVIEVMILRESRKKQKSRI